MKERLRAIVVGVAPPAGVVCRRIAGTIHEVATWNTAAPLEPVLHGALGLDDADLLAFARAQSVAEIADHVDFAPLALGAIAAEIVGGGPFTGAFLLESLAHADPTVVYVVAPIAWRQWILHAATEHTDRDALAALLAAADARRRHAPAHERLPSVLLFWPGNRAPTAIALDETGTPAPSDEMTAMMPAWR